MESNNKKLFLGLYSCPLLEHPWHSQSETEIKCDTLKGIKILKDTVKDQMNQLECI